MRKFAFVLLLLAPLAAAAQTPARFDLPTVTTTPAQVPVGSLPNLLAVTNATVSVCQFPAVLSGGAGSHTMCTNTVTTYTDSTLSTACPSTAQLTVNGTSVCIPTTGLQGSFGFWYNSATQSHMTYTIQTKWGIFGPYDILQGGGSGGSGSVTNFASGNLAPLFTTSVANSTTTPALSFTASPFAEHSFYGNNSASTTTPVASLLGTSDWSPNAYVAGSGSAQVQAITLTPAATALVAGLEVRWLPIAANTAAQPTLNVNGLGAKVITKLGTTALVPNDITTAAVADAIYDGTRWQLQNPQTGSGGGCAEGTCLVNSPTASQTITLDTNGTNSLTLANPNAGASAGTQYSLSNGTDSFFMGLTGTGASSPGAGVFNTTRSGAPMTFATNSGWMEFQADSIGHTVALTLKPDNSATFLGKMVVNSVATSPSTSPICPNGTGGAFTTSGCSAGGGLPTATAPGQIISSTAAGTAYAVVGSAFYQQSADTVASVNSQCSSPCTYYLVGTMNVTASASFNSNVNLILLADGQFNISSAQTLTISSGVQGALTQHFTGAGSVVLSASNTLVPVEWFGAIGDWNGTTGTNNLTAIQAAINATSFGQVLLQPVRYAIGGTLTYSASSVGMRGAPIGRGGYNPTSGIYYSSLIETVAGDDAIDVHGTSGTFLDFGIFQDFNIMSSVAQTGTSAGLSLSFAGGVTVRNLQVIDFFYPIYLHSAPSYANGGIFQTSVGWTSLSSAMASPVGFFLDSGDGNAENSVTLRDDGAGIGSGGPSTAIGAELKGIAINDADFFNFNFAKAAYGIIVDFTGSGGGANASDIHIWNSTFDGYTKSAILVENVPVAGSGTVQISGGWGAPGTTANAPVIDIESSSGVSVSSFQLVTHNGNTSPQGIYANSSDSISIANNYFLNQHGYPIEFNSTNHSSITDNIINNQSSFVATGFILVTGTSSYNLLSGNNVSGYTNAHSIDIDTGTSNTTLAANTVDPAHITGTPLGVNGTGNTQFNANPNSFRSSIDTTGDTTTTFPAYRAIGALSISGWNALTVTRAWGLGFAVPGGTAGNDPIFGYYNGTSWLEGWHVVSATGAMVVANALSAPSFSSGTSNNFNVDTSGNYSTAAVAAATSSANVNSPFAKFIGNYWTGTASATDTWSCFNNLAVWSGSDANPQSRLECDHAGSSGGGVFYSASMQTPNMIATTLSIFSGNLNLNSGSAASSGANFPSSTATWQDSYWSGSSLTSGWNLQAVNGTGTNPTQTWKLTRTSPGSGAQLIDFSVEPIKLSTITATTLLATGIVDGTTPIAITTSATNTLGGTYASGYTFNNDGATAVTYTLPVASAGLQYCVTEDEAATGTITLQTSGTGQFIDNAGGYTASGGFVISGGALADAACAIAKDSTHWKLYVQSGTWTTH